MLCVGFSLRFWDYIDQNLFKMEMTIFKRIYDIPVVKASVDSIVIAYSSIKESRAIPEAALTTAEDVVSNILQKTKIISEQVKDEIASVDNYAVQLLDKLETNAPFIMKQPNELLADVRQLYSDVSSNRSFSFVKDAISIQIQCASTVVSSLASASSITSKTTKVLLGQLEFAMNYFANKLSDYLPKEGEATAKSVSKDEALKLKEIADLVQEKMMKIYEVVQNTLMKERDPQLTTDEKEEEKPESS